MIYRREGMRHQCWSLVIVSTERGRQVGDEVLHHGLPRSRESPVYRRGHGESVFACASTLVRRGEYRAQTGIWRLLNFVSVRTIKGRSIDGSRSCPGVTIVSMRRRQKTTWPSESDVSPVSVASSSIEGSTVRHNNPTSLTPWRHARGRPSRFPRRDRTGCEDEAPG